MKDGKIIWIADSGADTGKTFSIEKMKAYDAYWFFFRLSQEILKADPDLPEGDLRMGVMSLGILSLKTFSLLDADVLEAKFVPKILDTISFHFDKKAPHVSRKVLTTDFSEVLTFHKLVAEWFRVHLDFIQPDSQ